MSNPEYNSLKSRVSEMFIERGIRCPLCLSAHRSLTDGTAIMTARPGNDFAVVELSCQCDECKAHWGILYSFAGVVVNNRGRHLYCTLADVAPKVDDPHLWQVPLDPDGFPTT